MWKINTVHSPKFEVFCAVAVRRLYAPGLEANHRSSEVGGELIEDDSHG